MDKQLKSRRRSVDYNELFYLIDYKIRIKKSYLNPSLSLKDVCLMVGTNRTYASRAVATRYKNFQSYLSIIRLESLLDEFFSSELLYKDWEETEELALRHGFQSRRSLDRAMIKEMGVTFSKMIRLRESGAKREFFQ
jgi:AraC-like DNA-binding protein